MKNQAYTEEFRQETEGKIVEGKNHLNLGAPSYLLYIYFLPVFQSGLNSFYI